jgi:hypothetical protein
MEIDDGWPVGLPDGDWQFQQGVGAVVHLGDMADEDYWTDTESLCGWNPGPYKSRRRLECLSGFSSPARLCVDCLEHARQLGGKE